MSPPNAEQRNAAGVDDVGPSPVPDADVSDLPDLDGGGVTLGMAAGWAIGILVLAGLVTFVLHFGDLQVFLATLQGADPLWLVGAAFCQAATYVCASAVWWCVLRTANAARPLSSLFGLALVELFANQAVPTAGLSGSVMVVRGLIHRGVQAPIAMTALLVAALSYYAAYLLVGLLAFILLWNMGDLSAAWKALLVAFFAVILLLVFAIVAMTRSRGRFIPNSVRVWHPVARLADVLKHVRMDVLGNGRVVFEAVALQTAIFALDAATLWCAMRAVGMNIDPAGVFISFVLASVVATLSPIPLGLGTFEGTATAMLHVMGGSVEASLAATLILRGFTLWLPMLPGLWLIRREGRAVVPERGSRDEPSAR